MVRNLGVAEPLHAEAVEVLQHLVRINTVNPPGNERPAQEYLAGLLDAAGFETTMVGPEPERPNLVARLRGRADGPVLGLLSHVDTVVADPAGWRHDPWSGDARRRARVGARRARHEVADGGRGRRGVLARARGLAARRAATCS